MIEVNTDLILKYFFLSGLITVIMIFYDCNFSRDKEGMEDLVANITWITGIDRKSVLVLIYVFGLVGGFFLLPWELVSRFSKKGDEDE